MAGGHTDGPRGRPCEAPRGRLVRMWRAHGYSGPWLDFRGGNALGVYRPLIYRGENVFYLPCRTMFPHGSYLSGDVAAWQASDRIRAAEIKTRGRHGGDQLKGRLTRQKYLSSVEFEARQSRRRRPIEKKDGLFRRLIRQKVFNALFFRTVA